MKPEPINELAEKVNAESFCGCSDWSPRWHDIEIGAAPILVAGDGKWINLKDATILASNISVAFIVRPETKQVMVVSDEMIAEWSKEESTVEGFAKASRQVASALSKV
jgi:hypothetical protein